MTPVTAALCAQSPYCKGRSIGGVTCVTEERLGELWAEAQGRVPRETPSLRDFKSVHFMYFNFYDL